MTEQSPPRRTCPVCARRYAGLVEPDCPVCQGVGVLSLGAAALAHYDTPAVARAIELYLEAHAQRTRRDLPLSQHRPALEAAVDNLRTAGVLTVHTHHTTAAPARPNGPRDPVAARVAELDAHRVARDLGTPTTTRILAALAAPLLTNLADARPIGQAPTASATGHPAALHTIANPLDALGPDTAVLENRHTAYEHRARVIAASTTTAATRRRRTR